MRKDLVALGTIAMCSSLFALWSWNRMRAAEAHAAGLEKRVAELQTRADRMPSQASAVTAVAAPSPATVTAAAATADPDALSQDEKEHRANMRALHERERARLRDPAYREMQKEVWRRQSARTRADAIRIVGMTPEQADRVIDLRAERNLLTSELGLSFALPLTDTAKNAIKHFNEAEEAELRAMLGQEKFERWMRYQQSGGERNEVARLRVDLATTAEPLGDSQADALVETLYLERERRSQEYEEYLRTMGIPDSTEAPPQVRQRWIELEKEANQRIHDAAATSLTRKQLASLDEMLAARVSQNEAALRLELEAR